MHSRHLFTTAAAVWGLLAQTQAFAQSTCGDDTCPPGHTCTVASYESCDYECADSDDGPGECAATSCKTEEYTYCERAACETDADCGGAMVCHTFDTPTCATPACAPGEECTLVDAPDCSEQVYKQCTPRAELPCSTAADCGEGYECEEAVSCSCSGMATAGATPGEAAPAGAAAPGAPSDVDASAADPAPMAPATTGRPAEEPPADCNCSPSGIKYCQLKELPCETDADCPAAFNCIASPGTCWGDSEGNTGCSEGSSMCYPESVPGGGMAPTNPVREPAPVPQADDEEASGEPTRDDDAAPGTEAPIDEADSSDDGSFGGIFGLFGCSVKPMVGAATGTPWTWVAAGLASLFVRRRRA